MLLLMSGCSSLPKLTDTLPAVVELTDTPFFPQEAHQCGPAALATVLNFRALKVSPEELTPQVYLPERQGSLQIEIAATARRYGMLAYPLTADLSDLLAEVAAGNPVLVMQNLSFYWLPQWHYAVVVGYDLGQNEIILRSGKQRRRRSHLGAFNNTWERADHWALVILPPDEIPVTAQPDPYLRSAFDLESTDMREEALSAYRAARTRWPDEKRAWLALGNSAFHLKRLDEAYTALNRALSLDPADPNVLNNLAYVYLAAGCAEQARATIRQALLLRAKDKNLLDSKQEIDNMSSLIPDKGCRLNYRQ